jgi:hypothetical protein
MNVELAVIPEGLSVLQSLDVVSSQAVQEQC